MRAPFERRIVPLPTEILAAKEAGRRHRRSFVDVANLAAFVDFVNVPGAVVVLDGIEKFRNAFEMRLRNFDFRRLRCFKRH